LRITSQTTALSTVAGDISTQFHTWHYWQELRRLVQLKVHDVVLVALLDLCCFLATQSVYAAGQQWLAQHSTAD